MMSLAVPCGETAPNREEYRERLYDYLRDWILANPQKAREALDYFEEYFPCLDSFATNPSQEWAYQISNCDEMKLFLNEIDWKRANPPRKLHDDEKLPSLVEILEMIPSGRNLS
jgi:hypothetical protein